MRIAITGHRDLYGASAELVETTLRRRIEELMVRERAPVFGHDDSLVGITCLADGADRMFAHVVLDMGGSIEVVVPAADYREGLPENTVADYDRLLAAAAKVRRLDFPKPNGDAYMAASLAMLEHADHLIAIWDGLPARGPGGTADVVEVAKERKIGVTVVWPNGARRGAPPP